ncbi:hypothetical protein [Mucilaginibacter sp. KACC 22063]|uniref:hypothetical protein n=1 Tax=Mucilaginibacter sp. KACC 22063 TaxID=3025666 RepID=UPI00236621E5|nr:hypothetical protein [Mucilaginibacter sp. KACC 22063]WDF55017.1 hypothetical protein PQ461_18980 [Mucilaginibacter sp. KACC 22063]
MLKGNLYQISDLQFQHGIVNATIRLDAGHEIFKGHYPAHPVLPGACMLEMIKEVLSDALVKPLMMHKATQIKFLKMIDPRENRELKLEIKLSEDEGAYKANATLIVAGSAALKFQGVFK